MIGSIEYNVRCVKKEIVDSGNDDYVGRIIYAKSDIMILDTMTKGMKFHTLWHEILHALCHQRNIKLKEGELDALAYGIIELLRDNSNINEQEIPE